MTLTVLPDDTYSTAHQMIGVRPRVGFPDDGPAFTYTVDLSVVRPGWPELVAFDFDGASLINALAGAPEPPLGLVRFETSPTAFMVRFVDARFAFDHYLIQCFNQAAQVAQIICPDLEGRFPWEPDCAPPYNEATLLPVAA